jgi:hypothetical protein
MTKGEAFILRVSPFRFISHNVAYLQFGMISTFLMYYFIFSGIFE